MCFLHMLVPNGKVTWVQWPLSPRTQNHCNVGKQCPEGTYPEPSTSLFSRHRHQPCRTIGFFCGCCYCCFFIFHCPAQAASEDLSGTPEAILKCTGCGQTPNSGYLIQPMEGPERVSRGTSNMPPPTPNKEQGLLPLI